MSTVIVAACEVAFNVFVFVAFAHLAVLLLDDVHVFLVLAVSNLLPVSLVADLVLVDVRPLVNLTKLV